MRLRYQWIVAVTTSLGLIALGTPSAVGAVKKWRDAQRRAHLTVAWDQVSPLEENLSSKLELSDEDEAEDGQLHEETWDDAFRRQVANRDFYGSPSQAALAEWTRIAGEESRRWPALVPRVPHSLDESRSAVKLAAEVSGTWLNMGPTDARFEYNGTTYTQVDSGRINDIRMSPIDPATVYVATSGGGVWKTFNFGVTNPTWFPITETTGNLAIGALDMDPVATNTLYAGTGDSFDTPGGQVLKTTDGGATWLAPVSLSGIYPWGQSVTALRIRAIRVDPANPAIVLVATEVGLFRSTDAGASYALVDLPNTGTQVAESTWTIAYTGAVGGVSRWAVSGVYASSQAVRPPGAGAGAAANTGDIWVSTDGGATWSSRKAAGTIPTGGGRIALAAGTPSTAATPVTTLYAQVGTVNEAASAQLAIWRSTDSGNTFTSVSGTIGNPTTGSTDCTTSAVAHGQAWYNLGIAVDPADDSRVLLGGNYCGIRTRNGLAASPVWENVSHWLPTSGRAATTNGRLPYVHADWHAVLIARIGAGYRVFAGVDGGIFYSDNVFDPATINDTTVTWGFPNRGLVTHLVYPMGSGDPVTGNPFVTLLPLQDNGTRLRDAEARPTTFNQVMGGDGVAGAVLTTNTSNIYWSAFPAQELLCSPAVGDCGANNGSGWYSYRPPLTCTNDAQPFNIRYTTMPTIARPTLLTISTFQVYRLVGDAFFDADSAWTAISPCQAGSIRGIRASPVIDGVIGIAMAGGRFSVTSNCPASNNACTWTRSNTLGFDVNGDGSTTTNELLTSTSSVDFPPTTPSGKSPGDVYVASSVAPLAGDAISLVSPALGRLFITQNRGTSWAPLHGNGTGFDLPNVPISVVRFDPADLSNNTLYAGTDLGVYRTTDGGQTWSRFGAGLPMVRVTDLFIGQAGNLLRVATYGRGAWELYPNATSSHGVSGDGDFDRNGQIDFIDLAATSARLGTDPTTSAEPYYDWRLDEVGASSALDEGDLSKLLTKFGGSP